MFPVFNGDIEVSRNKRKNEWELEGSRQLRGGALGQLDREQGEKKGQLCPGVSWIHCVQSALWRTDKKMTSIKTAVPMQYANHSIKDGGWSEKSPRSA